jgi:DNA replication and repair protein RecF
MVSAARVRRLTLTNFRSYRSASIEIDAGPVAPVVLVGPNGAGKTNLMEAISFLVPGRGLRRATFEEVAFTEGGGAGEGATDGSSDGSWAVAAEVEGTLGLVTLGTGMEPLSPAETSQSTVRKCRVDREPVGSAAAFADHLRVVWLVPAMDSLFAGPPSERRRFLDRLVLAVDAEHASRVSALERSLR